MILSPFLYVCIHLYTRMLDKNNTTNQRVYADDVTTIMGDIEIKGGNFADRIHELLKFYIDTHGLTYGEMLLQDYGFVKRLSEKLDKYNGTK